MNVVWLWPALADLNRLEAFIRERDPSRIADVAHILRNAALSLEDFPERCRTVPEAPDFRELFVEAHSEVYVIQFRIDGDTVVIVRVWHGLEER